MLPAAKLPQSKKSSILIAEDWTWLSSYLMCVNLHRPLVFTCSLAPANVNAESGHLAGHRRVRQVHFHGDHLRRRRLVRLRRERRKRSQHHRPQLDNQPMSVKRQPHYDLLYFVQSNVGLQTPHPARKKKIFQKFSNFRAIN